MSFILKRNNRALSHASMMDEHFGRNVAIAALLRIVGHALMAVSHFNAPLSHFDERLALNLTITFLHLPLWLWVRRRTTCGVWGFTALHVLNLIQFPLETIMFGSNVVADSWFNFTLAHLMCCLLLAYSSRKAICVGATALACLAAVFIDRDFTKFSSTHGMLVMGTLCFSFMEWMGVRLAEQIEVRDAKIRELAVQHETGLRMLSHDMANILSVANENLELAVEDLDLQRDAIAAPTLACLDEARFALSQGVGMLHATRDYLAIVRGKKDPGVERFFVHDLLCDVAHLWQRAARRKNITIAVSIDISPDDSLISGSRPVLTHTIVGNLVSNAIKFSPERSVITIRAVPDADARFVVVEVKDQGVGVSEEKIAHLFDPSARTTSLGTSGEVGTGFGLPLVKATLEAFGGSIEVVNPAAPIAAASKGQAASGLGLGPAPTRARGTVFRCRIPRAMPGETSPTSQTGALTQRDMKAS